MKINIKKERALQKGKWRNHFTNLQPKFYKLKMVNSSVKYSLIIENWPNV